MRVEIAVRCERPDPAAGRESPGSQCGGCMVCRKHWTGMGLPSIDAERLPAHSLATSPSTPGGSPRSTGAFAGRCVHPVSPFLSRRRQPPRQRPGGRPAAVWPSSADGRLPACPGRCPRCSTGNTGHRHSPGGGSGGEGGPPGCNMVPVLLLPPQSTFHARAASGMALQQVPGTPRATVHGVLSRLCRGRACRVAPAGREARGQADPRGRQ